MQKNTAGKWTVFAYGLPDNATPGEPITGDAANITASVRLDGGADNPVDDTNPTELAGGYYVFDITAAESNADQITIIPSSSTADVQVIGVPGVYDTTPPNFPELGIESDGDITKVDLVATTTTNTDMRGTDSALLAASAPANFSALGISAGGAIDDVTLVATTTTNTDMRGTDSAFLAASAPANFSALGISAGGAIDDVTLTATLTTYTGNTPQTGDNFARLGAPAGASVSADIAALEADSIQKNAVYSNFEFLMVLTSDHVTPATGLTVTGQRSIDGGAFGAVSGTITEVSNGIYQFDAVAADTNGDVITWRFSAATADDTFVTFNTST